VRRSNLLPYIHPVTACLAVALLGYVGSLGLRARSQPRQARQHLARHARLAPLMYVLVLASWVAGVLSTWLLRHDLEVAASVHFRFGVWSVLALSGSALSSRWMGRREMRAAHPWFGAAAMLIAAAQVFFGLQITP